MPVGVPQEGLFARRGEFDRTSGLHGQQSEGELEALVLAVGGGAGHSRDDDLHALRFQAVAGGGRVAVGVRVGGRHVELDPAVGAGHGEAGLRADRGRVLAPDAVQALDDDLARRVRVAVAQRDVADQVAVGVQGSASNACSGSVTGSSVSYSTMTAAAAMRAVSGWSAATAAMGSPW